MVVRMCDLDAYMDYWTHSSLHMHAVDRRSYAGIRVWDEYSAHVASNERLKEK